MLHATLLTFALLPLADPVPASSPPAAATAPSSAEKSAAPADTPPAAAPAAGSTTPATSESATPAPTSDAAPANAPATAEPSVSVKVDIKAKGEPKNVMPKVIYVLQHALLGGAVAVAVLQCVVLLAAAVTLWVIPASNPVEDQMPREWRDGVAVVFLVGVVPGSLMLAGMGIAAAVISAVRGYPDAFGSGA
jgi:hypothetical protein